ncbi:MAG TPA: hypothetical protein VKH15_17700 [Candidatus Acidoferrum sp.]|nr:hypothetical protein [Candidatus Acidoferrum sp.]
MSSTAPARPDLCTFTFADGRQCRSPHSPTHLHLCTFHARKEAQAQAAASLSEDVSYFFSGEYLSATDLSNALGRLFPAVVQGHIKPKTASTLAYLAQTLLQTIQLAQHEFTTSCGTHDWKQAVIASLEENHKYRQPLALPTQQATGNDRGAVSTVQHANPDEPSPD